jgi:hypothetical protein
VLTKEHNLLAGGKGPGFEEARKTMAMMRGSEIDSLREAVHAVTGGKVRYEYGKTKMPKALRKRVDEYMQSKTMQKQAFIAKAVRALSTPIKGTPKLVQKVRGPEELAALEKKVRSAQWRGQDKAYEALTSEKLPRWLRIDKGYQRLEPALGTPSNPQVMRDTWGKRKVWSMTHEPVRFLMGQTPVVSSFGTPYQALRTGAEKALKIPPPKKFPFGAGPAESKVIVDWEQALTPMAKTGSVAYLMSPWALCRRKTKLADALPGGLYDKAKKKPKLDPAQMRQGIKAELEHTSSRAVAADITRDHLTENEKYYTDLKKIEKHAVLTGNDPLGWKALRRAKAENARHSGLVQEACADKMKKVGQAQMAAFFNELDKVAEEEENHFSSGVKKGLTLAAAGTLIAAILQRRGRVSDVTLGELTKRLARGAHAVIK